MSSCGYGSICTGCNRCGKDPDVTKMKRLCPQCGIEPPADARTCPECGSKLAPPFPPPPGTRAPKPAP